MEQKLSISIGKPCSQKFNQFKTTESGGFCNSCKKEVIDFRNKSDQELIEFFKKQEGNTCGYFKTSQLKTYSHAEELKKTSRFKYLKIIGLAFFSAISFQNVQAQEKIGKIEITEKTKISEDSQADKSIVREKLLKGTVSYESNPLPGVNIILKGTTIGVSTNFDGEFEFPKALKVGDVLVVSYLGFVTQHITIKNNQSAMVIKMTEDMLCMLGEVEVQKVYSSKRTFWQKIKGMF